MRNLRKDLLIFLLFRVGIFLNFFGHGYVALNINKAWISYLEVDGFSKELANNILPVIGVIDIIVALIILIKHIKIIELWAIVWAFLATLIRPISGESVYSFIERGSKWMLPLIF